MLNMAPIEGMRGGRVFGNEICGATYVYEYPRGSGMMAHRSWFSLLVDRLRHDWDTVACWLHVADCGSGMFVQVLVVV